MTTALIAALVLWIGSGVVCGVALATAAYIDELRIRRDLQRMWTVIEKEMAS